MNIFRIILLTEVENFIFQLSDKDQLKISGAIDALRNRKFEHVSIKQLRGEIKELRVKRYRLLFFIHESSIYIVRIFIKKSAKAPVREIDFVEKFYKIYKANI